MKNVMFSLAAIVAAAGMVGKAQTAGATSSSQPQASGTTLSTRQATPAPQGPVAPSSLAPAPTFPPVNPKNFTAPSPTTDTMNSFLKALWGYDENRQWSVAAIQPTPAAGVVRVIVLVAEKTQPGKLAQTVLYITPDGKHAIAGEVIPFGAQPFAELRATLQQHADGPARGAAGKELEIVEFADLQCPNCKAAQGTMDQIVQDFPQAHVVFQNLPIPSAHPFAMKAAEIGNCVRKAKGDPAFFTYAQKVYDTQGELTADRADTALRAAVTAAGADPATVMTCASLPETQAAVEASVKLAQDAGVSSTPTLVVNGRMLPMAQVPYEVLKKIIVFQGQLDGVAVKVQPSLKSLK